VLRGQYTYTATSRAGVWDQGAGWKVQSVAAVPGAALVPDDVVRAAVRQIGGFVPPPLPELASRADVDALPRCLRLDTLDERTAALGHVVAAGPDYSGRPNFFAHGLLVDPAEEEVDEEGFLRPGDLWDADLWLRPLGTQAVEGAAADASLRYLSRGPLDTDTLEAFTRDHPNQRDLVLAAFERHVRQGPSLVVVGDAAESVAQWVRLLGLLLLPANAWRTRFSTYERLRDASTAGGWTFAVVGVPEADAVIADRLPGEQYTVLHDDRAPERTALGQWALPDGTPLTAGPWAQLAETVVAAGLLPEVTQQIDALTVECGDSTADQPLWALGAAVLLLDDQPMAELERDAAELVLQEWPADVELGPRTTEVLLARLAARISPPSRVTQALLTRSRDGGGLAVQLAFLGPVRAALADPAAYARLGAALTTSLPPLSAGARRELDDVLADALAWVPLAGRSAPRALLSIAALIDQRHGDASVRAHAVRLAEEVLLPGLLAEDADPGRAGWPPMPGWLWVQVRPALAEELSLGRDDPGLALTSAVHSWLGELSLPRGPLSAAALEGTGPVEWERAAHSVFRRRAAASPLERAAAYLATVNSSVINEGKPEDRWAASAVEDTYTSAHPLDLTTATILMHCLPGHIPFWPVLVGLLPTTVPSADTAAAVALLRERETVPDAAEVVLEPHEGATGAGLLITSVDQVRPLVDHAVRTGGQAWVPAAEAVLRIDVDALPLHNLPGSLGGVDTPWDAAWESLDAGHPEPEDRLRLAGNLVCRTARLASYPAEDPARLWLTPPAEDKDAQHGYAAAAALLAGHEAPGELVALVERLTREVHAKQVSTAGRQWSDGEHPDQQWRWAALAAAQQIVRQLGGSPLSRALRRSRG
jgi:hypothetical protein